MNKRKIILFALSVIVCLISCVTFTYAWLQINIATYVTGLDIHVELASGINVSVNGADYSSTITEDKIREAIVVKYLGYSYRESDGAILDKSGSVANNFTKDYIETKFAEIVLKPVSTLNGSTYTDKYNRDVYITDGQYISFDLYFKALDNDVDIYYNSSNYNYDDLGNKVSKFKISSEKIQSSTDETSSSYLTSNLTTIDSLGNAREILAGSSDLEFSAADAMRFTTYVSEYEAITQTDSLGNTSYVYDESGNLTYNDSLKFYELNEGLGSYATDLDSTKYSSMYLNASYYDVTKNAQATYCANSAYNGAASSDDLKKYALSYDSIPYTYKSFETQEAGKLMSLENKGRVKKATFTFWVEGYDADCFDVLISNKVSINMTFTTNYSTLFEKLNTVNYHEGEDYTKTTTLHYYDLTTTGISDILLPQPISGKTFKGWYYYKDGFEELTPFDFSLVNNETLVHEFDVYAYFE